MLYYRFQVQLWNCNGAENNNNQIWDTGYMYEFPFIVISHHALTIFNRYNKLPTKSEQGQTGINNCGSTSSQSSMCQTMWMNDATDFCLWAPPTVGNIGDTEREEVAWCTKSGRGTRVIPNGTLKGVHFVRTKDYVQVTGVGNFTKINVKKGDEGGGEYHYAHCTTSPI